MKQETSQINNLTLHLKQLEKEKKNPKVSRRKEIVKIRLEINEKEMKEIIAKISKTKSWTSLAAQWLRIHLPMQETQVPALVREDSTFCRATKPVRHNY